MRRRTSTTLWTFLRTGPPAVKIRGADIWIRDLARETWRRLTFDPRDDSMPVWTPDGQRIIFGSNRAGAVLNLYSQSADGTGTAERLTTTGNAQWSTAVTPDGTGIIGFEMSPAGTQASIVAHLPKTTGLQMLVSPLAVEPVWRPVRRILARHFAGRPLPRVRVV